MKKVFDQTVRDLKREVNKKVLKVPGIEQKILDGTSNEPWGPHGSNLADIAQATRNYHEYQIIMSVIWKRINDTGKNWRHVYKGLTVLEYLVAHGSERVIDEIKEHSYQISTLSDFQYIDSSGRDQGSNVRKKSQSLVALVNDKERIHEVRQKALANRDKFRSTFSTGGMNRPSSYSSTGGYGDRYDDDRYGSKDEDRNGYGRERDYRDDDRYGRGGDSYSRDGERYGRESEERYGRESYRDDDYRASRGNDDNQFRSRNRSLDGDRNRSFDDDDRYSSRSGGGRGDDPSYDERRLERKLSEQSVGAPPSYEDAIRDARNHVQDERDGGTTAAPTPKPPSPPLPKSSSPSKSSSQTPGVAAPAMPTPNKEVDSFDEFDPRGSASAVPPASSSSEMDLFGTLSAADSLNSLALVPMNSSSVSSEADMPNNSVSGANFVALSSASTVFSQPAEDPFGDSPFKATPQDNVPQLQNVSPISSFQVSTSSFSTSEHLPPVATKGETISSFDFGESFPTSAPSHMPNGQLPTATPAFLAPDFPSAQLQSDVLGNLLPQAGPPVTYSTQGLTSQAAPSNPFAAQSGLSIPLASQAAPTNTFSQSGPSPYVASQVDPLNPISQAVPSTPQGVLPTPFNQSALSTSLALQATPPSTAGRPAKAPQPKDKFETKSTVWADTLNRGLVNLNISGPKINPLADIGIDFDQINRMEKRKEKEKSSATPVSTINMGKAMGSGSGIGRAGAGGIAPPPNPMMGSGMGMGMGMGATGGMGMGMGMGGAGGMGGMGMGMGMGGTGGMGMSMGGYGGGINQQMGMGMNMGMAQGGPMRPVNGMPPSPGMPGVGYNPMMGMGGYGPQQPYGGYR